MGPMMERPIFSPVSLNPRLYNDLAILISIAMIHMKIGLAKTKDAFQPNKFPFLQPIPHEVIEQCRLILNV